MRLDQKLFSKKDDLDDKNGIIEGLNNKAKLKNKSGKYAVSSFIEKAVIVMELLIAVLLALGIIVGIFVLIQFFPNILYSTPSKSYEIFQSFLGYALLLIVGAELIFMILYHSTEALLELILFVIARKMLIYSNNIFDLVLGAIALAIVFATMKYLFLNKDDSFF